MSDPFGSDDTDFDTYKLCKDAYDNAVAYLQCHHPPELKREKPVVNPLLNPTWTSTWSEDFGEDLVI